LQWKTFFTSSPIFKIGKLFSSVDTDTINELVDKAKNLDASYAPRNLLTYYIFSYPATIHLHAMLTQLRACNEVELAYPQCVCLTPHLGNMNVLAGYGRDYLLPAPVGINSAFAKGIAGGSGIPAVKFIDVEQGWILENRSPAVVKLPLTGINNYEFREHGAAVLDIVLGNGKGITASGIAPGVTASVISQWRSPGGPNDSDAILAAITCLDAGDILLLEMQTFYAMGSNKVWPAEVQEATFQAIRLATALGIIVIEAAGNGDTYRMKGNDLDRYLFNNKNWLNPRSKDFRDSGAVMVAAASMDVPHSKLRSSNYGRRIDCFAWGEGIAMRDQHTGLNGSAAHNYTEQFGGTSGASAIIAGAALVVQSVSVALHKTRLTPSQMRFVLGSELYGTVSANGQRRDKIGVMPDLEKIIDLYLSPGKFVRRTAEIAKY
jgi:hypothetical protein